MITWALYGLPLLVASAVSAAASLSAGSSICYGFTGSIYTGLSLSCGTGDSTGNGGGSIIGGSGAGSGINVPYYQSPYGDEFSASARAQQDYGTFKGSAFLEVSVPNPDIFGGVYQARAYGQAIDSLTIGGGTGQGFLNLIWTVTGSTASSGYTAAGNGAEASMSISVYSNGRIDPNTGAVVQGFGTTGSIYGGGTYAMFADGGLPFYFGLPLQLTTLSIVSAGAGFDRNNPPPTFAGVASADFFHTAILTGIEAFDAFGNRIANITLSSESGTIYPLSIAAAVPEPQTYAMLLAGLLMLGFLVRQRRDSVIRLEASPAFGAAIRA
jgi:hypothetical protein